MGWPSLATADIPIIIAWEWAREPNGVCLGDPMPKMGGAKFSMPGLVPSWTLINFDKKKALDAGDPG